MSGGDRQEIPPSRTADGHGEDIPALMEDIGRRARAAAAALAGSEGSRREAALRGAAARIEAALPEILEANSRDMDRAGRRGLGAALLDRLRLDEGRVRGMAEGIRAVAELPDPVGRVTAEWTRPNGLVIQRVSVPLGVIGIIYESRPNVTADAGALCLKSANAVILRGGSESFHSSRAIHACLVAALEEAGLPGDAVQSVPTRDREAVGYLLGSMMRWVDVVVPRGGKSLIARVQRDARVPVIGHLEGLCHVYVDRAADPAKALAVVLDSKMRRTGICGAAETLLVDRAALSETSSTPGRGVGEQDIRALLAALAEAGCELRGDEAVRALDDRVLPATEEDWRTEYLDAVLSVRAVDGVEGAIEHIARYGSGHTESILTEDEAAAEHFLSRVDSAIVLHNASTQFADGGEFGMGAEIGISTGRLHARGPVGVEQLTSYKYVVRGSGQARG